MSSALSNHPPKALWLAGEACERVRVEDNGCFGLERCRHLSPHRLAETPARPKDNCVTALIGKKCCEFDRVTDLTDHYGHALGGMRSNGATWRRDRHQAGARP